MGTKIQMSSPKLKTLVVSQDISNFSKMYLKVKDLLILYYLR